MVRNYDAKNALVAIVAVLLALGYSPTSQGAEGDEQKWDTRLNGIWKVTSYVIGGNERGIKLKYVFSDGIVVAAFPECPQLLPRAEGPPLGLPKGTIPQPSDSTLPPSLEIKDADASDEHEVIISVYKATTQKKASHSWIDLTSKWEEPEEPELKLLGLYQIDGDTLRLVISEERPTSMSPKFES